MHAMDIDWKKCAAVESVPGRMGGRPVLKGTRGRPEDLLINRDQGIDWLAEGHGIDPEVIRQVFAFYDLMAHTRHPA